jgi:hypothetical protein
MMAGPVRRAADQADLTLTLAVHNSCPWQRGIYSPYFPEERAGCRAQKERVYSGLADLDPDIVAVIDAYPVAALGGKQPTAAQRRKEFDLTRASAEALTAEGAALLIIEPLPRGAGADPLDCLGSAPFVEACQFRAGPQPPIEKLERSLARELPRVTTLDLDRAACPRLPVCDSIMGDTVVWWDAAHLTRRYAATLDDEVLAGLRTTGVVPPAGG